MSDLKTMPTRKSVKKFLDAVEPERRREDAREVAALMREVTGEAPVLWGDSLVGFGKYRYQYDSGRDGEWFLTGFSPRKTSLVLYVMSGFAKYEKLLGKLGKHKTGRSCLYVNKLDDIDRDVLRQLIEESVASVRAHEANEASRG